MDILKDHQEQHVETGIEHATEDKCLAPQPRAHSGRYFIVTMLGVYLGILFTKSEVARWERVNDMFLFREAHMYLIIGTAIVVAAISMLVIKRLGLRDINGKKIEYQPKPMHKGVIIGGVMFGAGWAITGACPGPIYAQVGAGQWMALLTLAGALLGMFSYAALKPRLPH